MGRQSQAALVGQTTRLVEKGGAGYRTMDRKKFRLNWCRRHE